MSSIDKPQDDSQRVKAVGIALDASTKAKLDEMAKVQQRSRSQVVRRLVAQAKETTQ